MTPRQRISSGTHRCAGNWLQEEGAGAARNASLVDTQMVTDAVTLLIRDAQDPSLQYTNKLEF